jgi:preprotein translocase subunit SecF
MKLKSKWLVVSLVVVAIAVLGITTAVFAAGPENKRGTGQSIGGVCGVGTGAGMGWNDEAVTTLLGMTNTEICTERQSGKSLVQIAAAKSITEEQLVNAIMTEAQTELQAAVTQEQADLRLATMRQNISTAVNRTTVGPNGNQKGCQAAGSPGFGQMMRGGNRQGGQGRGCYAGN